MSVDEHEHRETSATRFEQLVERHEPERSRKEAFGSAIVLLLLLIGLPALLLVLAGAPSLPHDLPGPREFARQLSVEDVVAVLVGIVWLAWLFFVVCVVLEVVAARRGGLAAAVPLGGPFQRLARVLIGALLLSGIMATPAQAVSELPAQQPAVVAGISSASMDAEIAVLDDLVEDRAEASAAEVAGHKTYTVKAPHNGYHDNLWDIAERHLGDGRRYHEIFELNKDRAQPDGRRLELARLIQPGWDLIMPDDAVGLTTAPAPAPEAAATPAPASDTVDAAADEGGGTIVDRAFDAVGQWPAGSGMLAASVLGALLLVRRRRIGRRPDDDARAIEADLRVAASTDRTAWLDVALRRLAAACRSAGRTPPAVYSVLLSDDAVELLISPDAPDGVEGWSVHDEGRRWRCERGEDTDLDDLPPGETVPYPALVSLGVDLQGRDVLVDLESAGGIVSVGGSPRVAEQVASSLAIQAATAPWAESVRVTANALPAGIADIGIERLTVVDDLADELDDLSAHVGSLPDDVLRGRIGRRAPAPARLVVAGTTPASEVGDRLGRLAGGGGGRALSVVVVGEHGAARWRIRVDDRGNLELPQLGIATTANRLGAEQVEAVADLFVSGREPEPQGERAALPGVPRPVDDAAWATAPHRVGVIGKVAVQGVDAEVPRIDQSLEIITYLALHPEGVHPNLLGAAIWPRGVTPDVLEAAVARARELLGPDLDGTHLLREDAEGRLSLAEAVVCDWHAVMSLLAQARRTTQLSTETDLLRRALSFVRGEPFEGSARGRYAWVARDDLPRTMTRVLVDAAERLVQLLGGDPGGAGQAAEGGLRIAPGHQPLWRSLLRARSTTEGVAGVHRTLEEMVHALRGIPLEAETEALVEELLPPTPEAAQA